VKDINTLTSGPDPDNLISTGTQAFFENRGELWVVDAAGVHMRPVKKKWPGDSMGLGSNPWVAAVEEQVLFRLQGTIPGATHSMLFDYLWVSDGTASGTFSLTDVEWGYRIGDGVTLGNNVYYLRQLIDGHRIVQSELWHTDGTREGTGLLASFRAPIEGIVETLHEFGGHLWFVTKRVPDDSQPDRYDLLQFDTSNLETQRVGLVSSRHMVIAGVTESKLFVFADADEAGLEPWVVDETTLNLLRLGNLFGDVSISTYDLWGIASTEEYFLFKSGSSRQNSNLYVSNGTIDGTRLLTGEMGAWGSWNPGRKSGVVRNNVLFQAPDQDGQERIWTTNGTLEGTHILTWPESGEPFGSTIGFTVFGGKLFFAASQNASGWEVFASDGTHEGTQLAIDIRPGQGSSSAGPIVATDYGILTPALDLQGDQRLWYFGGSFGNQRMVPFVSDYATNNSSNPERFRRLGTDLFFTAGTEAAGRELWKTSGTASNTRMVSSPVADGASSNATAIGVVGNRLLVATNDSLWALDVDNDEMIPLSLPATGPFTLARTRSDRMFFDESSLISLFFAFDGDGYPELWESDGTPEGTRQVSSFGFPTNRTDVLDKVLGIVKGRYLVAKYTPEGRFAYGIDPLTGAAERLVDESVIVSRTALLRGNDDQYMLHTGRDVVYRTDGTRMGTLPVQFTGGSGFPEKLSRLHQRRDGFLITGYTSETGTEMWFSDGTPEGTQFLGDLCPGACESFPESLVNVANHTFFKIASDRDDHVWVTDGTPEGTHPLIAVETNRGDDDFDVHRLFPVEDGVLAVTHQERYQIWYTDFTQGSARLISEGYDDGSVFLDDFRWGAMLGDQFIFQAEHPIHGNELFSLDLSVLGTPVEIENHLPERLIVEPSYPNPFTQKMTVTFEIPVAAHVGIEVFDMLGRRVWTSEATEILVGRHSAVIQLGPELASGVYHIRVQGGSYLQTIQAVKID